MREVLLSLVVMPALSVSLSTASATVTADPANLGTLGPVLETKLKEWLVAWRAVQPTLRVEQFKKGETGDMGPTWDSLHIDLSQGNPKLPLYVFSPDMRWVIDPFGALRMSKQNGDILAGFDVDNSVFLIDQKLSRQRSMLFSGPSGGTHEAAWLWNNGFVVAGYGEGQPKEGCRGGYTQRPSLYLVSIPRNSLTPYIGPESCRGVGSEYVIQKVKQKIPNVKFY